MPTLADARTLLQSHFGYDRFRTAQLPVVRSILQGHDTLAVLATGGGKSICFQVPALLDAGVTLVVSPLVALMHDQVGALRRRGLGAAALDATQSPTDRAAAIDGARTGSVSLLYVSPEGVPRLLTELEASGVRPRRLVVDEAHCISEWGHDFRPAYRELCRVRERCGPLPIAALTGSATPAVRRDIAAVLDLGRDHPFDERLGSFDRPNLHFAVQEVADDAARLRVLVDAVARCRALCLVYVPARGLSEGLVRILRERGVRAQPYHARLAAEQRRRVLEQFQAAEVDVVVATCAFGMGIDQPRVRLVVHWGLPATLESYYQEAGRAGRDGQPSRCLAVVTPRDAVLRRQQVDQALPAKRRLEQAWAEPGVTRAAALQAAADRLAAERLRAADPATFWRAIDRRRKAAHDRLSAVLRYSGGRECRRKVLLGWFGEGVTRCAGCDRCRPTR